MKNHAIKSVRAIKAAEITSKLNLRIRFSYAWVQLVSPPITGVLLAVPTNPLAFTYRFIRIEETRYSSKAFLAENIKIRG